MKSKEGAQAANIVLAGFMGTGKTGVGMIVAGRLGWPFVDTDELIEQQAGRNIADIINDDGEAAFRQMEQVVCKQVAAGRGQVIASGGGMLLNANNRAALEESGLLVCLTCQPEEIALRLNGDQSRPLLEGDSLARIRQLLKSRQPIYDALPNHIDTTHINLEQVANEVLALWQAM